MKINVMSDLHLEFGPLREEPMEGDILLLAGDIGLATYFEKQIPWLEEVCGRYEDVYMIMGNHEHYHGDFLSSYKQIIELTDHIKNFMLLDRDVAKLSNDVVLIGTTLWSAIDPAYRYAIENQMNDYRLVKNLKTKDSIAEFRINTDFIEEALKDNKDKKCIVMTHHAPSLQVPEIYRGNSLNSAYGSDLEDMIKEYKPTYWIHGHTHVSRRYTIGETEIVCNPRGYYCHEENPEFSPNLILEV